MVRVPRKPIRIDGELVQVEVSPRVSDMLDREAQQRRMTVESLMIYIHGLYGRLSNNIISEYLWSVD